MQNVLWTFDQGHIKMLRPGRCPASMDPAIHVSAGARDREME